MSIFGRDESPTPNPTSQPAPPRKRQPKNASQVTTISGGTKIKGEITGSTEVRIDGSFNGTLKVDSVVAVGTDGQVRGEIYARSVTVAGQVTGNIAGVDSVDVHSSGRLQGDVKAPRVAIADGAYFKGRVEMSGEAPQKPAEPAAESKAKPIEKPAAKPAVQKPLDPVPAGESGK